MLEGQTPIVRVATSDEVRHWNELVIQNPDGGSFLQTREFAKLKARYWKSRCFIIETSHGKLAIRALCRYVFPLGELWYFPKGPGVCRYDEFREMSQACRAYIQINHPNVFLVQFEPELPGDIHVSQLERDGLTPAPSIQASTSTVIINLEDISETVLAGFSKRARYYIRLGGKEKIAARAAGATEDNFRQMYALMATASNGRGMRGIRPYEYYRNQWHAFMKTGLGRLYFAYENNVPVVGAFITILGTKATYKDGGSDPRRKSKGASYLLQWYIMQEVQSGGVKTYDMWGSLSRRGMKNTAHPYYGVSLFKTAFNRNIIEYCGTLDHVFSPVKYQLWRRLVYPLCYRIDRLSGRHFY